MSKYNIFVFNVNTAPIEGLEQEDSDRIIQEFSDYISTTFNDKYKAGYWTAAAAVNITAGGPSHVYFTLPETEPVNTAKTFIASAMKLGMPEKSEILSLEVQHIREVDSVEEGHDIIRHITDVLYDQPKNVH